MSFEILALDPSQHGTGWALLTETGELLNYGRIRDTEEGQPGEFRPALNIADQVAQITRELRPSILVAERAWAGSNPKMTAGLERLAGAIARAVSPVDLETLPTITWRAVLKLKPDEYPKGGKPTKAGKPRVRQDFKAPAMRLALKLWPDTELRLGEPLTEATVDAALVGLAWLRRRAKEARA